MAKANAGEQQTTGGTTRTTRKGAGATAGEAAARANGNGASQANGGARKSALKSGAANGTTTAGRAGTSRPAADTTSAAASGSDGAAKASPRKAAAKSAAPAKTTRAAASPKKSEQAAKAPAKKSAGAAKTAAGTSTSASRGGKANLTADLREFVRARPDGWGHADWTGFLDHLASRGHDTSNPDEIGMQLERERLTSKLGELGLSGPRAKKVVDQFGTLWSLRHADAAELQAAGLTSDQVDQVARAMRD